MYLENDIYLYFVYRFIPNRITTDTCIWRMIYICILFTDSSQTEWQPAHVSREWYIFVLCLQSHCKPDDNWHMYPENDTYLYYVYRFIPNRMTTDTSIRRMIYICIMLQIHPKPGDNRHGVWAPSAHVSGEWRYTGWRY